METILLHPRLVGFAETEQLQELVEVVGELLGVVVGNVQPLVGSDRPRLEHGNFWHDCDPAVVRNDRRQVLRVVLHVDLSQIVIEVTTVIRVKQGLVQL